MTFKIWETKLIANLTKNIVNLPFDGIETLVFDSDFKIGVAPGSAQMDYLRHSLNPIHKKAWNERTEPYMDDYADFLQGRFKKVTYAYHIKSIPN